MKNTNIYDSIIVGAGAAGLTSAIFTCRRQMKTLIISKDIGGQANLAHVVENFPGVEAITGIQLMQNIYKQAKNFGAEYVQDAVVSISKQGNNFSIKTEKQEYIAKTVILAFGLHHRKLNVAGEDELTGRGVTYCANCDGPLYRGKTVAVIGGGNSALDAAEYLSKIASKVYLIHRNEKFRAEEIIINKVKNTGNMEILTNTVISEIVGDSRLEHLVLENVLTKEKSELKVDGAFIEIGFELQMDLVKGLVELNEQNYIEVLNSGQTNVDGIFAAGDATNVPFKQLVISAGQGAIAGLSAYQYLAHLQGEEVVPDWAKKS